MGETLSVAIGQSFVLTTALQLANLYATIANGGVLYRPYFLKSIQTIDGKELKHHRPEALSKTLLNPTTVRLIDEGLWGVVNKPGGTAYSQRIPGLDIAGKTGTAQVIRIAADKIYQKCENMKYHQRHHALFAGFAPAHDPVIAVAVIAEHSCHGASGAAPIAKAVIKAYLEKYWPETFGEKAILARLKATGQTTALTVPLRPRDEEEEDLVPDLPEIPSTPDLQPNNTEAPPEPVRGTEE